MPNGNPLDLDGVRVRTVAANGIDVEVAEAGAGPPVPLLHGFPHTWRLWSLVIPTLARTHRVVAADLRGLGGSTRAQGGYDAMNLSRDAEGVLDALSIERADVVGTDAGAPPAFVLALRAPRRVRRLVLVESALGRLPGAEAFFAAGPPWWFGLHAVPGLAKQVLTGQEDAYLDFFYRTGTHDGRGIDPALRAAFVTAYQGAESLRCAFEHYRAMPTSAAQIAELVAATRLTAPTLAVGTQPVGDALHRQPLPVSDDLRGALITDCGHLVALDRPDALLDLLTDFLVPAPPAVRRASTPGARRTTR